METFTHKLIVLRGKKEKEKKGNKPKMLNVLKKKRSKQKTTKRSKLIMKSTLWACIHLPPLSPYIQIILPSSISPFLSCSASCEFAYLIWSYSNSFACVCSPHNDNLEQSNNNRWLAATAYRQSYRNSNAQQIGVNRGTWVGDIQWLCSMTPSRVVQFELRNYR